MTAFRLLRIVGIAAGFFVAFNVSQAATAARNGGETVPGIGIAIAALSVFFLLGALANEATQGAEVDSRKDLLWGLSGGGFAITLARWVG